MPFDPDAAPPAMAKAIASRLGRYVLRFPDGREVTGLTILGKVQAAPGSEAALDALIRLGQYGPHFPGEDFDILASAHHAFMDPETFPDSCAALDLEAPASPPAEGKASAPVRHREEEEDAEPGQLRADPWGNERWARLRLGAFLEDFLLRGIEQGILEAAHFKVFLLLVTRMDGWNLVHETQRELAALVGLKPSRISVVLQQLEQLQCLQRLAPRTRRAAIRLDPNLVVSAGQDLHRKILKAWNHERICRELAQAAVLEDAPGPC